ncbi:WXG100 family type VII secretion target, partial [Streptomyces mirabilis]
ALSDRGAAFSPAACTFGFNEPLEPSNYVEPRQPTWRGWTATPATAMSIHVPLAGNYGQTSRDYRERNGEGTSGKPGTHASLEGILVRHARQTPGDTKGIQVTQVNSVGLDGMRQAQGAYQQAVDDGNRQLQSMTDQINTLKASWSGEASTMYQAAVDEWLSDFHQVQGYLQKILTSLQETTQVYTGAHHNTTQTAGELSGRIGAVSLAGF